MKHKHTELKYLFFTTQLIFCVVLLFFVNRWMFYLLNTGLFTSTTWNITKALIAGLRFDLSAILYINSILIVLWLIPFNFRTNKTYRKTLKWTFILINATALLANSADIVYYRFTLKRTTADIFSYMGVGGDFDKLLPQFLKDFWYIFMIWIAMVWALIKIYSSIENRLFTPKYDNGIAIKNAVSENSNQKNLISKLSPKTISTFYQCLIFVFAIGLTLIGMRGGVQLRPINILTAGNYAEGNTNAIVLNTPFTILQTLGKQELKPVHFFEDVELNAIYNPRHQTLINNRLPDSLSKKKNIVIIIVESLSLEHIGFFNKNVSNYKGFTPFLDEIASKSLTYEAISNGKKSIEGIPAILSGIPTLMSTPFISSPYSGNSFESLPTILKQLGYQTAFFHGGTNGTMGFDSYCKSAGFENYYGKTEYNNSADDDGSWGIWDEPYLQYFANKTNTMKQPFLSSVFTLSSHHPFKVPEKFIGKFPKGELPIQEAISYTDYSLRQYFSTASKMPWFSNTLFIITADHTSESSLPEYGSDYGIFRIPIIIYDPDKNLSSYSDQKVAQQIDILPTVLAYLNIKKPIFCFGNNLLDSNSIRIAVNYKQPYYQLITNEYLLKFDGEKSTSLFNISTDKILAQNLLSNHSDISKSLDKKIKAFIQYYNNSLIYNKMSIKTKPSNP